MGRTSRYLAVVLAVLVAGCGGDGGGDKAAKTDQGQPAAGAPSEPPASVAAGDSTSSTVASTTTTAKPGTPTTTAVASPASPSSGLTATTTATTSRPTSGARAPTPMAAGVYRYDTTGSTTLSGGFNQKRDMPPVTTLTVDQATGSRQRAVRDLRDASGNGSLTEMHVDYGSDGIRLAYLKLATTFSGISDVREFRPDPPPLVATAKPRPGDRLTFTMTGTRVTAKVTIEVLRTERLAIGGTTVDTLALRTVTQLSGEVEGTNTSETWHTPDHWLTVQEHSVTDARSGFSTVHTEYNAKLQRLTPG
jgi:hypothetical protein